jgi:predicted ArsR family transcriptional regulator
MLTRWDRRFLRSTRGRIVELLRRASRTVDELAQALGLTDNAVRAHLATLERDGLVQQRGVRRGAGKPAYTYELTLEAERLYPRAYGPLLRYLLDTLAEWLSPEELATLLRTVGKRVAASRVAAGAPAAIAGAGAEPSPRARLERAVSVLNELGGLAELEQQDGRFVIRGYSCPLEEVAASHPAVCLLAEALLAELIDAPVRAACAPGERPRCQFDVGLPLGGAARPGD